MVEDGAWDDDVDEPQSLCGRGVVELARRDRQECPAASDRLRQSLCATPCGHDAEGHLVEADLDVVGRDADVRRNGDLGSTPERVPVECGNDGNRKCGDAVEDLSHPTRHADRILECANCVELLEVSAGDERPVSAASKNQHRWARFQDALEGRVELVDRCESDRVADLGPVDRHDGNPGFDLHAHITRADVHIRFRGCPDIDDVPASRGGSPVRFTPY